MVLRFDEFVEKVETLGFLFFTGPDSRLPCLASIAPDNRWHTGEDTDPWVWKDRAAMEHRLAYGCLLGGHKGFVSRWMYPVFYAAFRPDRPMEQRWEDGEVSATVWALWKLFEDNGRLRTDEIRRAMGVTGKRGAGRVDGALRQLMGEMYITVAGSQRKCNRRGEPYGWSVNIYERVEDWAPDWVQGAEDWPREEAIDAILAKAAEQNPAVGREDMLRLLGLGRG